MLNEVLSVVLSVIVMSFSVSITNLSIDNFINLALVFAIIFMIYIFAEKIAANYYQCSVETKIWSFKRYGLYERSYFKNNIPIGIFLPIIVSLLSLGRLFWLSTTQSEISALKSRVAKKHDFYSFSELTEWHVALIPAFGIFACLVLAVFAYLLNYPLLGRMSILFAFFNMIPIGALDGAKIFFGSVKLWFILAVLTFIGTFYSVFLI